MSSISLKFTCCKTSLQWSKHSSIIYFVLSGNQKLCVFVTGLITSVKLPRLLVKITNVSDGYHWTTWGNIVHTSLSYSHLIYIFCSLKPLLVLCLKIAVKS